MFFNKLYHLYGRAPMPLRKVIVHCSGIARFFLRPFLGKIHLGGYVQILDPSDNGALNCFAQGENYEKLYVDLFLSYVSCTPSGLVLDIGANYGQYSLAIANITRWSGGRIFAFEPDSVPFRCLQKSVRVNGFESFFSTVQVIIGETSGIGEILKSESSSLSNRAFISKSEALEFRGCEKQRVASIDEILAEYRIEVRNYHVFIKIDIEGNEAKAFRGARRLLEEAKGYFIQFEYYPFAMKEASEDPDLFREFLSSLSFETVLSFARDGVRPITRQKLFAIMQQVDANARPTIAENFVIIKNCCHPGFIRRMLSL